MTSVKRTREQTHSYTVEPRLAKRLKKTLKNDGSVQFDTFNTDEVVIYEIRDDLIQYIYNNHTNLSSICDAFQQFKGIQLLSPFSVFSTIPLTLGSEPFMAIIKCLPRLVELDFFETQPMCCTTNELSYLISICHNEGFELLLREFLNSGLHLSLKVIAEYLYKEIKKMEQNKISRSTLVKLCSIITCSDWVTQLDHNSFIRGDISLVIPDKDLINFLGILLRYGQHEYILNFINELDTEWTVSQIYQEVDIMESWMDLISYILEPMHQHFDEDPENNENFLVEIIDLDIWQEEARLFSRLFRYASQRSFKIIMTHCDLQKMLNYPDMESVFFNFDIDDIVCREVALIEFAKGTVFHRNKQFSNTLYREIVDRINVYLESCLNLDTICISVSYEFMVYCETHQEDMQSYLYKLVQAQDDIKRRSDGNLVLLPNNQNTDEWLNVPSSTWKVIRNHRNSILSDMKESKPESITNTTINIAVNMSDEKPINYASKMYHFRTDTTDQALSVFQHEVALLKRCNDSISKIQQIAPRYYDSMICDEREEKVTPMMSKNSGKQVTIKKTGFIFMELMDCSLRMFLNNIIDNHSDPTVAKRVLRKLMNNLDSKLTALSELGIKHTHLSSDDVLIKGSVETGVELFISGLDTAIDLKTGIRLKTPQYGLTAKSEIQYRIQTLMR